MAQEQRLTKTTDRIIQRLNQQAKGNARAGQIQSSEERSCSQATSLIIISTVKISTHNNIFYTNISNLKVQ